ncbi:hypothetical protein R1flu_013113 [Riccia fluitans]|uniref:Uncharacterized protein n=1 Tax=Riccia fluitans TaxID=41844 RepID=A0ABD1ZCW0_9MARC
MTPCLKENIGWRLDWPDGIILIAIRWLPDLAGSRHASPACGYDLKLSYTRGCDSMYGVRYTSRAADV